MYNKHKDSSVAKGSVSNPISSSIPNSRRTPDDYYQDGGYASGSYGT